MTNTKIQNTKSKYSKNVFEFNSSVSNISLGFEICKLFVFCDL